ISIWDRASNDQGAEPDVVMASAGDIPTKEALAAVVMLREFFPDLRVRFVNVVDLMKLQPASEHPHGLHDRGYKEKGNINTPLDLAIQNQIDRFSLAIDAIDRVPALQKTGAHAKEKLRNMQIECLNYAHEHGADLPQADNWTWPH